MKFCPSCDDHFGDDVDLCPEHGLKLLRIHDPTEGKDDPFIGRTIEGRYKIDGKIGAGGMGAVLDFGLAKVMGEGSQAGLTRTGQVFGTPAYMSPEQARGESADLRADLYAVGCILWELLAGRRPRRLRRRRPTQPSARRRPRRRRSPCVSSPHRPARRPRSRW